MVGNSLSYLIRMTNQVVTTEQNRDSEISLCKAIDLLEAIFQKNFDNLRDRYGLLQYCSQCGKTLPKNKKNNIYCSGKCRKASNYIKVVCSECGKTFEIYKNDLIVRTRRHKLEEIFCSRECLGKFVGKNYGFKSHPENSGNHPGNSKYLPLIPEIIKRQGKGESLYSIGKDLRIPEGSLYTVVSKLIKHYVEQEGI